MRETLDRPLVVCDKERTRCCVSVLSEFLSGIFLKAVSLVLLMACCNAACSFHAADVPGAQSVTRVSSVP